MAEQGFDNPLVVNGQRQNLTGPIIPPGGFGATSKPDSDDDLPPGLKADYTQAQRSGLQHLQNVDRETEARIKRHQDIADQQYNATAIQPGEFQRWDAGVESKKYQTDPIQAFGSLGSVFGMIASAFTRAPMENALNASAAAMNAIRAGDEEAYNRAHEAWKENTDLAFKRHAIERERLGDALRLMDTDMAAGTAKARMVMNEFGMQKELVLLDHGMFPELYEMQEKRADALNKTGQAVQEMSQRGYQRAVFERDKSEIFDKIKDPVEQGRAVLDAFNNAFFLHMKPGDPRAQALGQFIAETRREKGRAPTADELIQENEKITKALTTRGESAAQRFMREFFEENPNATSEEFAKAFGDFQRGQHYAPGSLTRPSISGTNATIIEDIKKDVRAEHPDWTDGQVGLEAEARFKKSGGMELDDATMDSMADQAIAGDTSVFTNLGRGVQGSENVIKLRKRIAEKLAAQGKTGAAQAANTAQYQGLRAAERAAGAREVQVGVASREARNMMSIAREASSKVARTRFVPLNVAIQAVEAGTSDPELAKFTGSTNSLVNAYVRAISPTGVPTDVVRNHAYAMLNTAQSDKAYNAVLDTMDAEMSAALAAPEQMKKQLMGEKESPAPADNVIRYDKNGNRIEKKSSVEPGVLNQIASFLNPVGTAQAEEAPQSAQAEPGDTAHGFLSQPIASQEAELRAYEPTWRDRLANFLMPDKRSFEAQRIARETIGSSGIGSTGIGGTGPSALDLTPAGAVLSAQEAMQAGNPSEAGAHAMSAAIPVGGAAVRTAMPLARPLVRQLVTGLIGAGVGAGTTLGASEAEAEGQEGLTPEQKEILRRTRYNDRPELLKQFAKESADRRAVQEKETRERQATQEKEAREKEERAKRDEEAKAQLEAEVESLPENERALYRGFNTQQRTKFWADKAEEKHQTEERKRLADEKEKEEYKERTASFRDRYKTLNSMLPWIGTAAAAAIPYAVKLRQASAANEYIKNWEKTAEAAEKALKAGDKTAAAPLVNTLKQYNVEHAEILKTLAEKGHSPVTVAAAATLPFDASFIVPNAYDATVLPKGAEAQRQGWENLTNPSEYGSRLPSSILEGLPPAVTATKIPVPGRTVPPTARSKGLATTYREQFPKTRKKVSAAPTLPQLVEEEELPPGLKPKRRSRAKSKDAD